MVRHDLHRHISSNNVIVPIAISPSALHHRLKLSSIIIPPHPNLRLSLTTTANTMTSAPSSDVPQTAATATEAPRAPEPMQVDQPQGHQAMGKAPPWRRRNSWD
jgi:hypothetical protein